MYALYDHYGFSKGQIGQLFIVGFGSSMVFGTIVGGLADRYGRRLNCLLFALLYGASCVTKHFNNFEILLLGRLLGGVATSILFSAFETWMIHEHRGRGFADDLLSTTFSGMTFGSSLVAIVAGLVASALAANFGFVAPFDASLVLLAVGGAIIASSWRENYGEGGGGAAGAGGRIATGFDSFGKAWRLLRSSERVLLLGLVQSAFESAMYIFVFMWTPALEASLRAHYAALAGGPAAPAMPHGVVFAIFMVCCMIGSKLFETAIAAQPVEAFARWVFGASAIALAVPMVTSNHMAQLVAFCVFEVCCGMYFPSAVRLAWGARGHVAAGGLRPVGRIFGVGAAGPRGTRWAPTGGGRARVSEHGCHGRRRGLPLPLAPHTAYLAVGRVSMPATQHTAVHHFCAAPLERPRQLPAPRAPTRRARRARCAPSTSRRRCAPP